MTTKHIRVNQVLQGDCIEVLRTLPDGCIHCCVTSPPYWGLRDYGVEGQLGLEKTPDEYVAKMVEVFHEVRRVLRDDGTLWLNLGDSYCSGQGGRQSAIGESPKTPIRERPNPHHRNDVDVCGWSDRAVAPRNFLPASTGIKPKDLCGIPWRVAFALQADGWYLRQDIIWAKPNPMPESVTDRCTKAHEYIFLMSKSPRYFYDAEAIKEENVTAPHAAGYTSGDEYAIGPMDRGGCSQREGDQTRIWGANGRNKRSVWTVATAPFKEAHFATFPPELIRPCIKAGCPQGGIVLDPFGGAGTTGYVAAQEKRGYVLIELNPAYVEMAKTRLSAVETGVPVAEARAGQLPLFGE